MLLLPTSCGPGPPPPLSSPRSSLLPPPLTASPLSLSFDDSSDEDDDDDSNVSATAAAAVVVVTSFDDDAVINATDTAAITITDTVAAVVTADAAAATASAKSTIIIHRAHHNISDKNDNEDKDIKDDANAAVAVAADDDDDDDDDGNNFHDNNFGFAQKRTKCRAKSYYYYRKPLKWMVILCFFFLTISTISQAEKSKHYYMQSLCKNHFLQQLYRKIDGAVLWSQNERNLDCIITFQTHSILQRFMLRFDMLQLDCNDHLYVYDGAHAVGTYKADLSCRNTKQSVGSLFTRTNFVTLKYVTDGWGTDTNGFKLVITAVKDPKHACKDYRCTLREFCIHPDLICDGVNHCGDNSDEAASSLCQNQDPSTLLGLELTWFVLVAVSSLLIICACIVGWSICVCRRKSRNIRQNTSIQLRQSSAESNGSSKHLHGTLPREHTTIPSSGNWHHPAGPSGYHRIQHKLKMATKVRPIWCLANLGN